MVVRESWPPVEGGVQRITVSLDPVDVDLIDRLSRLEGVNRSAELRALMLQIRPVLQATVAAFEAAVKQRERLDVAVAEAQISGLQAIAPQAEELNRKVLGILASLEGSAAADAEDPRPSNTGVTPPTPTNPEDVS